MYDRRKTKMADKVIRIRFMVLLFELHMALIGNDEQGKGKYYNEWRGYRKAFEGQGKGRKEITL